MNENIFNFNKNDKYFLSFLSIFSLILIFLRTKYHMSGGIYYPDKALYLINSLIYGGFDYYNIVDPNEIFFSPIISFLTSILFKFGITDQLAISLVSSFFAFIGFIGLYVLLRNRFNPLFSLTGVIIFGSISEFLFNLSSGLIDIPSISISILIILFTIIATDKNSKYFLIVFPLLVVGFFIRYTVVFTLPVVLLYFLIRRNFLSWCYKSIDDKDLSKKKLFHYFKSEEFKYIFISLILSIIIFLLICKFLILDFGGNLTFIEQSHNSITNKNYGQGGTDVLYDKLFYIKNFSEFLFDEMRELNLILSSLLFSILGCGVILKFINYFKNREYFSKKNIIDDKNIIISIILLIILMIIGIISFKVFSSHIITNLCILIALMCIHFLMINFNFNENKESLNILFLSYFLIYSVFIAIYPTKVLRYALPLLPPFIYFIILGLEAIMDTVSNMFEEGKIFKIDCDNHIFNQKIYLKFTNIIPIILIIIFLTSTLFYIMPMEIQGSPNELVDVTEFIVDNDDNYHQKVFASNSFESRQLRWYLKTNISVFDDFEEFDDSDVNYIIIKDNHSFENYHEIYHNNYYHVYYNN